MPGTNMPRACARLASVALLAGLVAACGPQNNGGRKQLAQETRHGQQEGRKGHGIRAACADDIQKYCASADRKRRCLKQNSDKLSDVCKTALAEARNRRRERGNDNTNNNNGSNNTNNSNANNKGNNASNSNNGDDDDN
ncbi:MAG TPA: hypothetical protein VGI20_06460 [Rhizomicrobium sp.]|jgi:hypothetical protein